MPSQKLRPVQKSAPGLLGEHSAILSTFIKLPFSIKTFILSIFKWPLKTGFTVICGMIVVIVKEYDQEIPRLQTADNPKFNWCYFLMLLNIMVQ